MNAIKGLLTVALGVGALACTDAGATVYIMQNQVPSSDCVATPSPTGTYRPIGRVDVEANSYLMFPLVYNHSQNMGAGNGVFFAEGADIVTTFPEGFFEFSPNLLAVTERFSGPVPAGGYGVFAMNALSPALMQAIRDSGRLGPGEQVDAFAEITIFGNLNGKTIEGYPFTYPIKISNGLLRRDLGTCSTVEAGYDPGSGFECDPYAFQDEFVACCTTSGGFFLCPAAAEGTTL